MSAPDAKLHKDEVTGDMVSKSSVSYLTFLSHLSLVSFWLVTKTYPNRMIFYWREDVSLIGTQRELKKRQKARETAAAKAAKAAAAPAPAAKKEAAGPSAAEAESELDAAVSPSSLSFNHSHDNDALILWLNTRIQDVLIIRKESLC